MTSAPHSPAGERPRGWGNPTLSPLLRARGFSSRLSKASPPRVRPRAELAHSPPAHAPSLPKRPMLAHVRLQSLGCCWRGSGRRHPSSTPFFLNSNSLFFHLTLGLLILACLSGKSRPWHVLFWTDLDQSSIFAMSR